jgi:hypothetical protein
MRQCRGVLTGARAGRRGNTTAAEASRYVSARAEARARKRGGRGGVLWGGGCSPHIGGRGKHRGEVAMGGNGWC